MKKWIGLFGVLLVGCQAHWVVTPAPSQSIDLPQAAVANGVLHPQELYFTLISQYQVAPAQARVIILTDPAFKLADMTVSSQQIQLHEKAPRIPSRLVEAWGKLVQQQFLTPCPARKVNRPSQGIGGTFELEVSGGVCL